MGLTPLKPESRFSRGFPCATSGGEVHGLVAYWFFKKITIADMLSCSMLLPWLHHVSSSSQIQFQPFPSPEDLMRPFTSCGLAMFGVNEIGEWMYKHTNKLRIDSAITEMKTWKRFKWKCETIPHLNLTPSSRRSCLHGGDVGILCRKSASIGRCKGRVFPEAPNLG